MSELKVIYLGPACQEQGDGREWCEDDVWQPCECGQTSVKFVASTELDRVTAERDALQLLLNERDERLDSLEQSRRAEFDNGRAAEQRNEELSGMLQHLVDNPYRFTDAYRERIAASLNPNGKVPDQLRDAAKMIGIERMPPMEYDEP